MPKILFKREKIILFATVCVIIFAAIFNLIIGPFFARNENLDQEISLNKKELRKYAYLLSQKKYIESKYNKLSQNLKYPESGENLFINALTVIEKIAKESNIRLIDVRPQSQKNQKENKEILIELKTEGSVEGYLQFLYNIENSLSLLLIKKFQLNSKANTQDLEGSFSISQLTLR